MCKMPFPRSADTQVDVLASAKTMPQMRQVLAEYFDD
jgi:hypothetical protein